jgi:hypothetical protein
VPYADGVQIEACAARRGVGVVDDASVAVAAGAVAHDVHKAHLHDPVRIEVLAARNPGEVRYVERRPVAQLVLAREAVDLRRVHVRGIRSNGAGRLAVAGKADEIHPVAGDLHVCQFEEAVAECVLEHGKVPTLAVGDRTVESKRDRSRTAEAGDVIDILARLAEAERSVLPDILHMRARNVTDNPRCPARERRVAFCNRR